MDIPAVDWKGIAITDATCAACAHAQLRARGDCEPGRCCMADAYARRIDRFFRTHPRLANRHLAHPYFEVRAIAAQRLPAPLLRARAIERRGELEAAHG